MVQGPQFSPIFGKQPFSSISPSVQKHLNSEAFRSVLSGLGIRPGDIKGVTEHKGLKLTPKLQDVRFVQISQDTAHVLAALGINNAEVAIAVGGASTISELKKKLGKIRQSTLEQEDLEAICGLLGITYDEDGLVILDSKGGVTVVKQGLQDIENSLQE